jgi:hypothetical protein
MVTDIACVRRNHPISVKVRLIVSARSLAQVVEGGIVREAEGELKEVVKRNDVGSEREGSGVVEVRRRLAMRLRFTRVRVPTIKEYQHAESLLA